ncbi:hypothetical protein ACHELQ_002076 [Vibrio fluvialis]
MDKYYQRQEGIEKTFLSDVSQHRMNIIKDDGVYRHIRFNQPGTSSYMFDLITYPSFLVVSGDMGCSVFSRVDDMFSFFRSDSDDLKINQGYWAEKLQAIDAQLRGREEWTSELHNDWVKEQFDNWCSSMIEDEGWSEDDHRFKTMWRSIKDELLSPESEHEALMALENFDEENSPFSDWWESYHSATRQYPTRLIWHMFAIVWGIKQYDAHHAAIEADKAAQRAKRKEEQEEHDRLYRVYFEYVEGAPFQVGDKVKSGKDEGVVHYLDYAGGCGESYPDDPMICVNWHKRGRHTDATEHLWKEEIELIKEESDA